MVFLKGKVLQHYTLPTDMTNYRGIPYPKSKRDLEDLLTESHKIADTIQQRLSDAPLLSEIFFRPNRKKGIDRQPKIQREQQWSYKAGNWEHIHQEHGRTRKHTDFEGLYAFAEKVQVPGTHEISWVFRYVGISRSVMTRLKQHGWGRESNTATFAHLIAKQQELTKEERDIFARRKTDEAEQRADVAEKLEFARVKMRDEYVKQCKVVVYRLENDQDYALYFHEVAVAGILRCYWNSFRTH